ncbi:hypothetical protein LSCM1_05172 [Leishmania martiniquensis]|uniref:Uncharacterized protein n=1 Tax=Leishmania martiniquensis TaxID=1580590 RepID=A0A836H5B5_9TRYP|nr:hypothetical protein LSCM1_05172 [Leishmania martiniquensis]
MKSVQEERNELLLYALRHPPHNVSLKLPDGCSSLECVDLTSCPSPVALYSEAENAARAADGETAPKFVLDMTKYFTFIGGSSGSVQRPVKTPSKSQSKQLTPPPPPSANAEKKPGALDGKRAPHLTEDSGSSSSTNKRGGSDAPQLPVLEESLLQPARPPAGEDTSAAQEDRGLFGYIMAAFKSLGSVEGTTAGLGGTQRGSGRPASAANAPPAPASAKGLSVQSTTAMGSSEGGMMRSLWSPLSSSKQSMRQSSRAMSLPGAVNEKRSLNGVAQQMEQTQIPLCGTTAGTISSNIAAQLDPVFEAAAEERKLREKSATDALRFPRPPQIQLCEVVESAPLTPFLDFLPVLAYESLLLATGVLLTKKRDRYERELGSVYRRVFNITDEQHTRSLTNVTPPALRRLLDRGDAVAKEERRRYISELRPDASTFRLLCDSSDDDDFVSRAELLESVIERYPDLPGDTQVPFSIRAMVFAACLIPLYQVDLSTLSPVYTEKDVENCLAALRKYFGIQPQTEHFCHLHAQLLANDKCVSVEAQAVFLKDVARAVSHHHTSGIADAPLTPPVKYAYYVLQETFCLTAVPMPWLDSSFSADMQRSVTAAFIETCLALPPCMLSAMVLVEDMPVLPPTSSSEDILLALMEIFVNSGVFRSYAELVGDKDDVPTLPPATLFRRIGSDLDTKQRAYCHMLTRSFPLAAMLIVPGRLRIGAYALLTRQWRGLYSGATSTVPKDYKASLDAFLDYLLDGCDGVKRASESKTLCALLRRSTQKYLAPLDRLAEYDEAAHVRFAKQLMEEISLLWADRTERAQAPLGDVMRYVRAVFGAPRPPPLGGDPEALQYARMCSWLDIATELTEKCLEGFPTFAAAASSGKLPALAAESERVRIACAELRGYPALVCSGVHRLHTIVGVQEGLEECLVRSRRQYDLVRRVTGAPPAPTDEIGEEIRSKLYSAVLRLCDSLSLHILAEDTVMDLLSKYMRLDAKQYKSIKRSTSSFEDFPMPLLYPDVTMRRILDEANRALQRLCSIIDFEPAVRRLRYRLGHNITAWLFAVYVDDPEVFLNPHDAPLILADLDSVRAFFEVVPDQQGAPLVEDDDGGALQGAELLDKLYSVVQYVMSKASSELITGGVGVPPLHTLPECSDDSPWCQYVVRRVLEHRKGFKNSIWENYKARVLTK